MVFELRVRPRERFHRRCAIGSRLPGFRGARRRGEQDPITRVHKAATAMDPGRYLLRELLWELEKFGVAVPGLTDAPLEEIEVLSWSGYDELRLRVGSAIFDARLDWSAAAAPQVVRHGVGTDAGEP